MRKSLMIVVLLLSTATICFSQSKKKANKDTEHFRYEIECAGNGTQGTYLVKVWSYSKKAKVAAEQCKKNAVHGIIFKGYTSKNGCVAQRAMVSNPGAEMEHAEFFDLFFSDNGEYLKYVALTAGTQEIIKVGKEYKVGVVVSVSKDALRKALESAGIIRSLSTGF